MSIVKASSWFRGIKGKLLMSAMVPVVGFIVAFVVATNGINKLNEVIKVAHKSLIPNSQALGTMRSSRLSFNTNMRDVFSHPTENVEYVKGAEGALSDFCKKAIPFG